MREYYEKVTVPQAPEEPDERVDRMTGLPYDMQAGGAFVDEEDRMGFSAAGLVKLITRLRRSPREIATDTRPVTKFESGEDVRQTLIDFRYREPDNFVDPRDPRLNKIKVKPDEGGRFVRYLEEEEGLTLSEFGNSIDKDEIIRNFQLSSPENDLIDIQYSPQNIYYQRKAEVEDRLGRELDEEFNVVPVEDQDILGDYLNAIPRVSEETPNRNTLTKKEFLRESVETNPQFHGKFFGSVQYDNELSAKIPRELGMHIGTKGQAQTITMRGVNPVLDKLIYDEAKLFYVKNGMAKTEDEAAQFIKDNGIPDKIMDDFVEEYLTATPSGVDPKVRQGFINVKNPLILDTDMINWNPAKFLGGYDPDGKLMLGEQAQSFVDALDAQVKNISASDFTKIVDDAATQIDLVLRKKEINSGKLLNSAYDYRINTITRGMLEDLGFDSIQYKNMGELTRASEKKAGGNSYILFRDDQFVTEFVPPYMRQPRTLKEPIPEVKKAYEDLKEGVITSDEYDKIVLNTIYPYETVPLPETNDAMFTALAENKRSKLNTPFEEGQEVGVRLDIPAYLRAENSAWVPTIHIGGKAMGHQSTAAIRDVDFTKSVTGKKTQAEMAQAVMEGGGKSPFAQMMGKYIDRNADQNYAAAVEAMNSDEWIQVGFDPRRHSYFYDRATGQPVEFADEVIQIGPLVLAKNAKYGDRAKYPYATGGRVLGRLSRVTKQDGGLISRILNAITNRKASSEENREMFKDGADDFRWGETRDNKYYVNHEKFKSSDSGPDYEREVLFGEALHSLKDLDSERYERIYNSAMNDPEMVNRLKEAQVFEGQQDRDFNEYVRNTRLDQIIGGYLTASPNSNVPTMRDRNFQRDSNIYGSGQFRTELETLAKDLNMTSETNPFFTRMSGE